MTNRKSRVTVRVALCVLSILGIGTGARELPAQAEATTRLRMPLWAKGGSHSPGAKPDIRVDDRLDDEDGFPNFFDTSAAAPHAAAVAALILQANRTLFPQAVYEGLRTTANDMGPLGFDFESGFGLVNAEGAVAPAAPPVCAGEIATITGSSGRGHHRHRGTRRHRRGER